MFLKHPQQFHLGVDVEVADFVKEDGASFGSCKPPLAVGDGSGEGSLPVAEHLALEEGLGETS